MMGSVDRGFATGLVFWAILASATFRAHGDASDVTLQALSDTNLALAVDEWISDPNLAVTKYGAIESWDTSRVTDMSKLFQDRADFNEDVSNWNTSAVTNMAYVFSGASSFHRDLLWDTRNVKFMDGIFNFATSFNGDISTWSTASLQSMDYAFSHASSFNIDISSWQTMQVKYMAFAFWNATSFSQDLSQWSVVNVDDMEGMFYNATSFDQVLCWKDLYEHDFVSKIFCGSQGSLDPDCVSSELLAVVNEKCDDMDATLSDLVSEEEGADVDGEAPAHMDSVDNTTEKEPSTADSVFPTVGTQAPTFHPTVMSTSAPVAGANRGPYMATQLQQQDDPLKYVAIAFATSSLALMVFLVFLVVYKRRQFKGSQMAQQRQCDAPTVLDDMATCEGE
jgi:surface protein